ncbi:hypothetical protein JCGZ_24659 [Jatropha curcas]|uniref:Uncharacterized protein n=1 Tax=Jatropha curcas TaxID=180498 RepID=A0A067L837_JATCU|nr:hypothetical protein JCGZ_24659 [Jatropha curcas]
MRFASITSSANSPVLLRTTVAFKDFCGRLLLSRVTTESKSSVPSMLVNLLSALVNKLQEAVNGIIAGQRLKQIHLDLLTRLLFWTEMGTTCHTGWR